MIFALKLLFAALVIYLILDKVGFYNLLRTLKQSNFFLIAISLIPICAFWILRAVKWKYFTDIKGAPIGLKAAIISILAGNAVGVITPGHLGEFSRVAFCGGSSYGRLTLAFIIDRLCDLLIIFLLATPGAAHFWGNYGLGLASGLVLAVTILLVLVYYQVGTPTINRLLKRYNVLLPARSINIYCIGLAGGVILTLATYAVAYLAIFLIVMSVTEFHLIHAFLILPLVTLVNLVPITPGAIGIREFAAYYLFESSGLDPVAGVGAFLIVFFIAFAVPSILGIILSYVAKSENTYTQ